MTIHHTHIARKLGVPIYQLLGGKVRDKLKVYAWVGGNRPGNVAEEAYDLTIPPSTNNIS